jgi:BirA family biotin operon repressor/biotin-[acetyl-CoA-carboxylase] ligase
VTAPFVFETVPGPHGTRFGVRRFAEIDSTNRYLLDEARAGAPDGTVALADHQSAGRGRLDRRWEAPAGANVLMSVLLRPSLAVEELHLCTVALSLAACAACEQVAGVTPELKWPNDIMVGERKLAGILGEVVPDNSPSDVETPNGPTTTYTPLPRRAVVAGIGLNVQWPGSDPDLVATDANLDVLARATSLARETGRTYAVAEVVTALLTDLEARLVELDTRSGRRQLAAEYRRRCATVGRTVRVSLADGGVDGDQEPTGDHGFTGTAVDITVEGHLVVDVGACFKTVAAGDVVHVRDPER